MSFFSNFEQQSPYKVDEQDLSRYEGGISDEELYTVEMVKGKRERKDDSYGPVITEYLIKYSGYDTEHDEWRTQEDLAYCPKQI